MVEVIDYFYCYFLYKTNYKSNFVRCGNSVLKGFEFALVQQPLFLKLLELSVHVRLLA